MVPKELPGNYIGYRLCLGCMLLLTPNRLFVVHIGADIHSVCTEAGMFAIRSRRKVATERDFIDAVNKVIKSYAKFSSTPHYMTYN